MFISDDKLDFWLANRYNVLFVGKHGVGKTSIVLDAFKRAGMNYLYYSASTMDPWVDMIGVPKEKHGENGESYLDLVRPKDFQEDKIEALFFDEFNRSHKKIRNAVMELIQFKSINGKKFNNLKVVWAAINPADEEDTYDVEQLDPAQEDRFHIKIEVPYAVNSKYFTSKYDKKAALAAVDWWKNLTPTIKDKVSPRRLDYALDIFTKGGDLRDVLPHESNVSKLILNLSQGPLSQTLKDFMIHNKLDDAKAWLAVENNYAHAIELIKSKERMLHFFLPLMSKEKISLLVAKSAKARKVAFSTYGANDNIKDVLLEIRNAGTNKKLSREIALIMPTTPGNIHNIHGRTKNTPLTFPSNKVYSVADISNVLAQPIIYYNTYSRFGALDKIYDKMPATLTHAQAKDIVSICSRIAGRSHVRTILDHKKTFFSCLNHALDALYKADSTIDFNWVVKNVIDARLLNDKMHKSAVVYKYVDVR